MEFDFQLSDFEKTALLNLAQETLNHLHSEKPSFEKFEKEILPQHPLLAQPHPCFVTLLTDREMLRGCIGSTKTFTPLYQNVVVYTERAALEDPRFPPVRQEEIPKLKIEISVLGPLAPLALQDLETIQIGTHGLVVRKGQQSGLLLAKVATEYGWTPKQFLSHTCEKAGLPSENVADYQISFFKELSF